MVVNLATPGELIEIVADALILPTATVVSFHRELREKGLITKSGRGRSATHVTGEDIAKLLITVMGSEKVDDAEDVCLLMSETLSGEARDIRAEKRYDLAEHMSLVDAIVTLLVQVKPRHRPLKNLPQLPFMGDLSRSLVVELEIWGSTLEARITDGWRNLDFLCAEDEVEPVNPDDWASLPVKERLLQKAQVGGLITRRSIDRTALVRISFALPEEPPLPSVAGRRKGRWSR